MTDTPCPTLDDQFARALDVLAATVDATARAEPDDGFLLRQLIEVAREVEAARLEHVQSLVWATDAETGDLTVYRQGDTYWVGIDLSPTARAAAMPGTRAVPVDVITTHIAHLEAEGNGGPGSEVPEARRLGGIAALRAVLDEAGTAPAPEPASVVDDQLEQSALRLALTGLQWAGDEASLRDALDSSPDLPASIAKAIRVAHAFAFPEFSQAGRDDV